MAFKDLDRARTELAQAQLLLDLRQLAAGCAAHRSSAVRAVGKLAHITFNARAHLQTDELSALLAVLQTIAASTTSRATAPNDSEGAP